jgi:hypothetical protein
MSGILGMFGISASLDDLTEEKKELVADLLRARNDYLPLAVKLNELKLAHLANPTPNGEKEIAEYASAIVAPVRNRMNEAVMAVTTKAVNVDKLKGLLPSVLMSVLHATDLTLLLTAFGIDPDMVEQLMGKAGEYFGKGASSTD